ncbi:MAG: PQQ-binding-like beta-propeller repeat protein, partial [Niveispirillum sp.]|nr:PQQ-binding-like beta-propeller repeat protein [Niveispirillum sp.]
MAALWLALALPAFAAPPGGETVKSVDQFQAGRDAFADPEKMPGALLYQENCAGCHQGGVYKAPHRTWLEMMTPSMLFSAMNDGMMQAQAAHLSREQRQQIAEYLSRQKLDSAATDPMPPRCEGAAARFDMDRPPAPVGWGHDTSRFVPAKTAGLMAADVPKLRLKWAFAFPNAMRARSQPAIGLGAVFVGSKDGTVYAFDLDTGCVRWTYQAKAEVRTAIVLDSWTKGQAPARPLLYFGDVLARAYALDMRTGAEVWVTKVDDHSSATITGSPALHAGRLYVPVSSLEVTAPADPAYPCCTFRGAVAALDAATGQPVWKSHTIPNEPTEQGRTSVGTPILGPSGAPVWNSPAVDAARGLLYVGSGENYASPADGNSDALMAFDLKTGQRRWLRQTVANDAWNVACMMGDHPSCPKERGPDLDYAASPILAALPGGGQVLLGGQKSGVVHGVDPDTGAKSVKDIKEQDVYMGDMPLMTDNGTFIVN